MYHRRKEVVPSDRFSLQYAGYVPSEHSAVRLDFDVIGARKSLHWDRAPCAQTRSLHELHLALEVNQPLHAACGRDGRAVHEAPLP